MDLAATMATNIDIVFNCNRVVQPIGTFYIGVMKAEDVVAVSYADIRRILEGKPRDVEEFSGIQRPLSRQRVEELRQYVRTVDAAFPTSVILQIASEDADYDEKAAAMRVKRDGNVAKIIDGQHRIEGLREYKGPFELNVTIFVDMDIEDQALLFATINLKQTKVNKSLAYDLYEFASARSPQKTCHEIARLLNSKDESPFYHKIKILGTATRGRDETLTQAGFIDRLMPYISDNPMRDRDALKRGHSLAEPRPELKRQLVFREFFKAERDAEIAKIVWNFFAAVEARWPGAWNESKPGMILNRTTGFRALMKLLPAAYRRLVGNANEVVTTETFASILAAVQLADKDFTRERYLPGTGGEAALLKDLLQHTGLTPV
jgi:DGQHR domain-containing protein